MFSEKCLSKIVLQRVYPPCGIAEPPGGIQWTMGIVVNRALSIPITIPRETLKVSRGASLQAISSQWGQG
jgi:hypothetical protein